MFQIFLSILTITLNSIKFKKLASPIKGVVVLTVCSIFICSGQAYATGSCVGRFLNPVTDVCWSCIFPISLGSINLNKTSDKRDTKNPSFPVCACKRAGIPVPVPGITIGFWEPVRLIEITRTPWCLINMNGKKIASGRQQGGFYKSREASEHRTNSFYHIHYYIYPLIYWLNLITDLGCLEEGSFDIAYFSELDPAHGKDNIANILNPETFLFNNPIAVSACAVDCASANLHFPSNSLFWCAGCLGSIYPFSGSISGHVGGVQASSLLAIRTLAKLHRTGLAKRTATSDGRINGPLCETNFAPKIVKDQYKLQMTYPIPSSTGLLTCNPLGMADILYNSGKEFPYKGEDFAYLVWRKRNCCFL